MQHYKQFFMIPQRIIHRCMYHIIATRNFCLKERIMRFRYMYAKQPWCRVDSGTHRTGCSMPCIIVIFKVLHWSQACSTTNYGTKDIPAKKDSFGLCTHIAISSGMLRIVFLHKSMALRVIQIRLCFSTQM